MKTTFKQFLSERRKDNTVLNWIYADIIFDDKLNMKQYGQFVENAPDSETPYYDFALSPAGEKLRQSVSAYIAGIKITDDVITTGENIEIYAYSHSHVVRPPREIIKCDQLNFKCHESTEIKVEHWWPKSVKSISINAFKQNTAVVISLSNIHKVVKHCEYIGLGGNNLKLEGGVLGLFNIEGLTTVIIPSYYATVEKGHFAHGLNLGQIITNCLNEDKSMFECQQILIDAGFEEYAKV